MSDVKPSAKLRLQFMNEKNDCYHVYVEIVNLESLEMAESALKLLRKQLDNNTKPKSLSERMQTLNS